MKKRAAMIMGSACFWGSFLVELLPLRFTSVLHLAQPTDKCSDILRMRHVDGVAALNLDNG